jgi:hypothetical protein
MNRHFLERTDFLAVLVEKNQIRRAARMGAIIVVLSPSTFNIDSGRKQQLGAGGRS